MTRDDEDAMSRVCSLFYEAGYADAFAAARAEVLCLPQRGNVRPPDVKAPRHLALVKP